MWLEEGRLLDAEAKSTFTNKYYRCPDHGEVQLFVNGLD